MKSIAYNNKELYWKRIQLISFVLAVFIIIRHNSSIYNYDSPTILTIYEGFKYSITEIAVPLFFIISGFNYFNHFSITDQKRKFGNRIKSLLVPYLVWNTVFCVFCIITSSDFFSQFFIGRTKFVVTPLNVIWGCIFHMECNSQFWFVFTLMVCVLINPLIYYVIRNKYTGGAFLIVLYVGIMFFGFKLPSYYFYRTDAFLYYYLGAFLGLHFNNRFIKNSSPIEKPYEDSALKKLISSKAFYILTGAIAMCFSILLLIPNLHASIRVFIILICSYGFWRFSYICRFILFKWLPQGGTTFLMYAAHGIIQPVTVKLLYFLFPKYNWFSAINFVLAITITVLLCMAIRWVTKRYLPIVDKIITGWRR